MQRYFINENLNQKKQLVLPSDDLHHVRKVMRNNNGDQIICLDLEGLVYRCEIADIDTGLVNIIETVDENNELEVEVTLVYALPKGDKLELVLQKATELGVSRIVPLQTRRCVVKMDEQKFNKKITRYQKILKEAAEQSRRNKIPEITKVIKLKDITNYLGNHNLVAYEEVAKAGEHKMLKATLDQLKPGDKLTIVVGSEGGFDEDEVTYMNSLGINSCSLGKRILRSETAPLYFLSVIGYALEIG